MPKEHDCYQADRVVRQFETLYRISRIIQDEFKGQDTFREILVEINNAVDYSSACIFSLDRENNVLEQVAGTGKKSDLISFVQFELGSGFSAWVAKYRRPIMLPNIKRYRESVDDHIRSFISVPILMNNSLIGVLNVSNERPGSYNRTDLELVCVIGSQISSLLERQYFCSELQKRDSIIEELRRQQRESKEKPGADIAGILADVRNGISRPIASMAGNTRFLQLSLKDADHRLKKSLDEIEESITKLSDFTYRIESIDKT